LSETAADWRADLDKGFSQLLATPQKEAETVTSPLEDGEVRKAAVLFLDLVDYTGLGEKLSLDELAYVVSKTFSVYSAEIKRHGGIVERYVGDALMAVFGAESASIEDTEIGVRAALGILRATESVNRVLAAREVAIAVRIGVNYGEVATGTLPDEGGRTKFTVTGDAVNTAQRLEAAAPANGILITEQISRKLGSAFTYTSMGTITVKGKTEPLEVVRVDGASDIVAYPPETDYGSLPLVGRESERAAVMDAASEEALTSGSRLVLISGRVGMGKTRLAVEIADELRQNAIVLEGGAHPYPTAAMHIWTDVVSSAVGQKDDRRTALDSLMSELAEYWPGGGNSTIDERTRRRDRNALSVVLGCEPEDETPAAASPSETANEVRSALVALVAALAARSRAVLSRPLVIVLHDLQWMDVVSNDLLASVLSSDCPSGSFAVIATARPEWHPSEDWTDRFDTKRVELGPLSREESRTAITHLLGGEPSSRLAGVVAERAGGNPLFLIELVSSLRERGLLVEVDGGWDVSETDALVELPDTMQAAILSRVDRLGREQKLLLQVAAVLGRGFPSEALSRVMRAVEPGFNPDSYESWLSELERRGLLVPARRSTDRLMFPDLPVVEVVGGTVLGMNRRVIHRLAAQAYIEMFGDDVEHLPRIAEHHKEAGEHRKSFEAHLKLAGVFSSRFEHDRAMKAYEAAEEDLAKSGYTDERVERERCRIALAMAHTCDWTGDFNKAVSYLDRVTAYAGALGEKDLDLEARVLRGSVFSRSSRHAEATEEVEKVLVDARIAGRTDLVVKACTVAGNALVLRTDFIRARQMYDHAIEEAERLGDGLLLARARGRKAILLAWTGDLPGSAELFREFLDYAEGEGNRGDECQARGNLGLALLELGEYEEAGECLEGALVLARQIGDRRGIAINLMNLGILHKMLRRYDEALEFYQASLVEHSRSKDSDGEARVQGNIAELLGHMNRYEESVGYARDARAIVLELEQHRYDATWTRLIAKHLQAQGRFDEALSEVDDGLKRAREATNTFGLATLDYIRGRLFIDLGETDKALVSFGQAIEFSRSAEEYGVLEEVLYEVGLLHASLGEDERAQSVFGTLVETAEVESPNKRFYEGVLRSLRGDDGALDEVGAFVIERYDLWSAASDDMLKACCFSSCGRREDAVGFLENALSRLPDDASLYRGLRLRLRGLIEKTSETDSEGEN
jgi:class 3 adenylate cyclase/tetratricopeptide (TPR) repeat protein